MEDLSLHILDIVENAIAGRAKRIEISISEEPNENRLAIEITDDGIGMEEEVRQKAIDPFFTTRTSRRVGLGLPLILQAAQEAGGNLRIESTPGKGTKVMATFQYDHIDRKPLGSMVETMMTLLVGHPELDFTYSHSREGKTCAFDSKSLWDRFENRSCLSPEAIQWVNHHLREKLAEIGVQG